MLRKLMYTLLFLGQDSNVYIFSCCYYYYELFRRRLDRRVQ